MADDIRLSISEAARLFGVSIKTIRQAIRNGELVYIIVNGRYKLNFKGLISWSQQSTRRRNLLKKIGIGQFVDKWDINNIKYSPRPPQSTTTEPVNMAGEPASSLENNEEGLTYVPTDDLKTE